MADDDKNIGPVSGSEDPWAGLDSFAEQGADATAEGPDAVAEAGESFELPEFESLLEETPATPEPSATSAEPVEPVLSGPAEGEPFGVPAFDALSLGTQDGVFTDEAAWNTGDPFAGTDDSSLDALETPLAVFPPADSGVAAEDQSLLAGDHGSLGDGSQFAGGDDVAGGDNVAGGDDADADALAHLEDAAESEADLGVVAFAQPEPEPSLESNPFGLNESLVVGDAEPGDGESLAGQSHIDGSAIQIGTGQSGIVSFDDSGDSPDEIGTDVSAASSGGENLFGEPSFDAAGGLGVAAAAGGAAAASGAAVAAPVRRVIKKRSGGGGIAAAVSVLLGGVLSIPIVIGLLFWVFKKDPFHIAPKIPASLSFLLPAEFQVAGQGRRPFPGLAGRDDTVLAGRDDTVLAGRDDTRVASRSLEDLITEGAANQDTPPAAGQGNERESQETAVENAGSAAAKQPDGLAASDLFDSPKTAEPKQPPPLDTSALDDAVAAADETTSQLLDASEEDPGYKRLLKDWYTSLSKVGEETVSLEQQAADSGSEFVAASPAIKRTIGRILADDASSNQFAKLSRMWLKSRGRTSDGVVLPAVLGSSRKVGAWWVSRVRVSDDPAVPEVAVLSRSQPDASEGDAVVVLGLVFEPGMVWAAVCGRFEPFAAENASPNETPGSEDASAPAGDETPVPARARGDDLFPLE